MANTRRADMRLDDETVKLLSQLSEHLGVNRTSIVKLAIRELARKEGLVRKEQQNMSLADALAETGIAETYWDGKTISVCDDENKDHEDVYTLSIAEGQMPPFFQKECKTLDEVETELKHSHFPFHVFTDWSAVEPD